MKLSEAIRLGSLYLKPLAGTRSDGKGSGCALGMAGFAFGMPAEQDIEERFVWLHDPCAPACSCPYSRIIIPKINHVIAHTFNEHICGDKTWTLDQLADWIASIEPQEPEACTENEQTEAVEVFV